MKITGLVSVSAVVIGFGLASTATAQQSAPATGKPQVTGGMENRGRSTDRAPLAAVDAEKLMNAEVENRAGDRIGNVEAVHLGPDGNVRHLIIGVGGFLGIGGREVALRWDDVEVMADGNKVVSSVTREQLEKMQPYRYAQDSQRGRVFDDAGRTYGTQSASGSTAAGSSDTKIATKTGRNAARAVEADKLIGQTIENPAGENIGEVEAVQLAADGSVANVLVGVGGFLGIGERTVAVKWSDLQVSERGDKVVTRLTKAQLEAMQPHRYASTNQRGTVFGDGTAQRSAGIDRARDGRSGSSATAGAPPARADAEILLGQRIETAGGENIGDVQGVHIGADGKVESVIVEVGGFLGIGQRDVALRWSDLRLVPGGDRMTTSLTKEQLETLQPYRFGNPAERGKVFSRTN